MSDYRPPNSPLLSELEALQGLLNDAPADAIPVLNDIIEPSPRQPLPREEQLSPPLSEDQPPAATTAEWRDDDHSRELFLQELIDDLLPQIEAELRQRLLKLDRHVLEQWYHQSRRP